MDLLEVPRTVDRPKKFLIWDGPDFMVVMSALGAGMLLGRPLTLAGMALVAVFFYAKYRDGKPDLYVIHALYWIGLGAAKGRSFINPFVRHFVP